MCKSTLLALTIRRARDLCTSQHLFTPRLHARQGCELAHTANMPILYTAPTSKVSRRRRAGHAPAARRGRRVRVPRACKRPAKTFGVVVVVVVVVAATPNYRRLASH